MHISQIACWGVKTMSKVYPESSHVSEFQHIFLDETDKQCLMHYAIISIKSINQYQYQYQYLS